MQPHHPPGLRPILPPGVPNSAKPITKTPEAVRLITLHVMAALLRCSVSSVYRMRRSGCFKEGVYQLPGSRVLRFDPVKILEQLRPR